MNKNILKYIPMLMALLMVSCSSDDTLECINPSAEVTPNLNDGGFAVTGTMGDYEFNLTSEDNKPLTRSTLIFDRDNKLMKFSWQSGDKIGIFYLGDDEDDEEFKSEQFAFVLDEQESNLSVNSSHGVFVNSDPGMGYPRHANAGYVSYIPYKEQGPENNFTYEAIPITFRNQQQRANVKMNCYWQKQSDTDENGVKYFQSEKDACAHLSDYNYQVSDIISTPSATMHFVYKSIATTVRFYMYAPLNTKLYFDSLQVVNNDADFVLDATMNVKTGQLTPVKTSHVLSLSFRDVDGPNVGIDMTNNTDPTKETYNYWDKDYPTDGYIMAYMMIAPINLKQDNIRNSTLYLCGHDKLGKKHYFSATLSKINFEGGKHYQWVVDPKDDKPITFKVVTVQEWESAVYGNNGAGTETW